GCVEQQRRWEREGGDLVHDSVRYRGLVGRSRKVGRLVFVVDQTSATSMRPSMMFPSLPISVTSPLAIALISSSTVANWVSSSTNRGPGNGINRCDKSRCKAFRVATPVRYG